MASVEISIEDFREKTVPFVCAVEGGPAERWYRYRADYRPSWPVVFILLGPMGWVVMLVVAAAMDRRVWGYLPSSPAAQAAIGDRRRRSVGALAGVLVAAVAAVAALVGADLDVAAVVAAGVGLVAVVAALVATLRPAGSIGVRLDRSGTVVTLLDVSPEFVEAHRRYRAALAAQRRAIARDAAGGVVS